MISNIKRKLKVALSNPRLIGVKLLYRLSPLLPDKLYLKLLFPLKVGYKLNLENPQTYNEKLQWIKLYYRKPIMSVMADKYAAKQYIENIIGDEYVVKNYGVWEHFNDIDFSTLPESFVLKTTHDQGGVVVVKDKNELDIKKAKAKLERHLEKGTYHLMKEWPYKNIQSRIIAEELLMDTEKGDLWDYKFYCFNGEPKLMYISHGRQSHTTYFDFYDMDFEKQDISRPGHPISEKMIKKPEQWELMKEISRKLSAGWPHLRVDFYCVEGKLYLGELTFFQGGGMKPFYPESWDYKLGEMIALSNIEK